MFREVWLRFCRLLVCAMPTAISGQVSRQTAKLPGELVSARAISADSAAQHCLTLGRRPWDQSVRELSCEASELRSAGTAADRHWVYGVYKRRWLMSPDAGRGNARDTLPVSIQSDTIEEMEVVLFTTRRSPGSASPVQSRHGQLTPVWHHRYDPHETRSKIPEVVPVSGQGALVAIDDCINGTGGCGQEFLVYRDNKWRQIRTAFLDSLDRRYPGAVRHGFHMDVHTFRARAALYADGDANCCPSRFATMTIRLRGEALELVGLQVRAELRQQPLE